MPCKECHDSRVVEDYREELFDQGPDRGPGCRPIYEMISCPECSHFCEDCDSPIWELEENGITPLQDYASCMWFCDAQCLRRWIANHPNYRPIKVLTEIIQPARLVYMDSCGCDFPGAAHSNGCHATVDELNRLIEETVARTSIGSIGGA